MPNQIQRFSYSFLFLLLIPVFSSCQTRAVKSVESCKLPADSTHAYVGLGFPRSTLRTPALGTVRVSVIFVDFSDVPAKRDPEEVFNANISPSSEKFITAVSYGKMSIVFDPHFNWFRMSKPSTQYGWQDGPEELYQVYVNEAMALADPTVDFSGSDAFLIIANPEAEALNNGPAYTSLNPDDVKVDGKSFYNGVTSGNDMEGWKGLWFVDEFGHTLSLPDLYSSSPEHQHQFVGGFSVMGLISGTAPELLGWERWNLGWLDDSQVYCSSGLRKGKITLAPVERRDNKTKLLMIGLSETSALVVESRHPIGYDSKITKAGLLVYVVDTKINTAEGVIKILPVDASDESKLDKVLAPGESLTYENITIKCTGSLEAGDVVEFEVE